MDLRVYVDGVARIICDLTRTTTVHDIIIALAQYKGKAGRYSLIQRASDGIQTTLSPQQLTSELIHRSNCIYILQRNPSSKDVPYVQKRSKSLDGRKTPVQQTIDEKFLSGTSLTDQNRTVQNKKRSNVHQTISSINTNNSNNNIYVNESPISQKRILRTPIQNSLENRSIHYSRPRSAVPSTLTENSAFHIVHNPPTNHVNSQQEQYLALLKLLKTQEFELEQQEKDLNEKEKEINYRQIILHQTQLYQENIQHEFKLLEERDRYLLSECQKYSQEYSTEKFDLELEYYQNLHQNYEHIQQQLTRCTSTLEQKKQLQEQLQFNIQQIHEEIQQIQTNIKNEKKELLQYEYDLEHINSSLKQQENLGYILTKRNEDIDRIIQQHQKQILEFENELMQYNDLLIDNSVNSSYHFNTPTSTDILTPVHFQIMNSTLLKLCPSGIWV